MLAPFAKLIISKGYMQDSIGAVAGEGRQMPPTLTAASESLPTNASADLL